MTENYSSSLGSLCDDQGLDPEFSIIVNGLALPFFRGMWVNKRKRADRMST